MAKCKPSFSGTWRQPTTHCTHGILGRDV